MHRLLGPLLVLVIVVAVATSPRPLVAAALAPLAFVVFTVAIRAWQGSAALRRFRRAWAPQGKDLLLVTSNDRHWKAHVEREWLPRWGARAVVLDWSDRGLSQDATAPEIALFRAVAGPRERHPLAVVVPPAGPLKVVRFWRAFRDLRQGNEATLRAAEAEVEGALAGLSRGAEAGDEAR